MIFTINSLYIKYKRKIQRECTKLDNKIDRDKAYELLLKYNKKESLIKHALAVEASMRKLAEVKGADPDVWGLVGLLHDLDYDMYPEQHCKKTKEILTENGYPEEIIRAVMCHGYGICTDEEPITDMEKAIYAVDELTGLITAAVLVRPSKSIEDLEVKSVKKKWKDKTFAAGVNREVIQKGTDMLGMELSELMQYTIDGMKSVAAEIGLAG